MIYENIYCNKLNNKFIPFMNDLYLVILYSINFFYRLWILFQIVIFYEDNAIIIWMINVVGFIFIINNFYNFIMDNDVSYINMIPVYIFNLFELPVSVFYLIFCDSVFIKLGCMVHIGPFILYFSMFLWTEHLCNKQK